MSELFLGLMSGTSADAIDAALVRMGPAPQVVHAAHYPLPGALQTALRRIDQQTPLLTLATLDAKVGEAFAAAAMALLRDTGTEPGQIAAVGSHGQTAWHAPDAEPPYTLQIGDPNIIAARTGITVVADFRRRDVACGGQGAPLVPAFHEAIFRAPGEERAVLNLGGIANITRLPGDPAEPVTGFDTGPANTLLDAWARTCLGQPFDRAGAWAASGRCLPQLLARLQEDPYFHRAAPKSTGPEHFNLAWLQRHLAGDEAPEDLQATLAELAATTVAAALRRGAARVARLLVCGGGVHNAHLLERLRAAMPQTVVESTAAHGIDPDFVEACAFAWLAARTLDRRPGNLPSVTGARREAVLGGVYYG